jgi:hypothetical protein
MVSIYRTEEEEVEVAAAVEEGEDTEAEFPIFTVYCAACCGAFPFF